MALETGTYISDLVATNPAAGDNVSQADDHLRFIKSAILATFPNVTGAVTPTHAELNYIGGVTSAIQTQLNAKAALNSPALTGTPTAPTASAGTNTTQIATTAFVASAVSALASSGSWVEITSSGALSADNTVEFNTGIDSTYDEYMVVFMNVVPSIAAAIRMRTSSDGGSTYDSTSNDYVYSTFGMVSDSATLQAAVNNSNATEIALSAAVNVNASTGGGFWGVLRFAQPDAAVYTKFTWEATFWNSTGQLRSVFGGAARKASADVNALQFYPSSGNFATGEIVLFGRQK